MTTVQTVYYRLAVIVSFSRSLVIKTFKREEQQIIFYEIKPCE